MTKPLIQKNLTNSISQNNRWFILIAFAVVGIVGSFTSIMVSAAGLIILGYIVLGKITIPKDPALFKVSMLILLYFLVNLGLVLYHFDKGANLVTMVELLPFLVFLPITTALYMSTADQILRNMQIGAAIGITTVFIYQTIVYFTDGGELVRWAGVGGNSGPFSIAILVLYAICLVTIQTTHSTERILYTLFAAMAAICVWMSGMRSAIPLILILPIIVVLFPIKSRKAFLIPSIVMLISVGLITYLAIHNLVDSRFSNFGLASKLINIGYYDSSLGIRFLIWEHGSNIVRSSPIAGLGESEALRGLNAFLLENLGRVTNFTHFHNLYFSTMVRGGLLELISTLLLLLGPLFIFTKYSVGSKQAQIAVVLMACTVSIYLICGLTNIAFSNDITDHLFILMTAICARIALLN